MDIVYNTGLKFNAVYVLESLGAGDLRTGLELHDSVLRPLAHQVDGLYVEYIAIPDLPQLEAALRRILNNAIQFNHYPILHIEAHGDSSGLQLTDSSYVPWLDITPRLSEINQATRMNLLVMAMMCQGWDLTTSLMPADRAPVFALIGPPGTIKAQAIQDATRRFYGSFLTGLDLNAALASMNAGADFAQWPIRPATAEILFCRVFRFYLQDHANPEQLQERENELVADMVRTRGLDLIGAAAFRQYIRGHIHDHEAMYNHLRSTFLMLDLFPENAARFGLTYAKCVAVGA